METPQEFNPFAEEYTPRLNNGAIEAMSANIENLAQEMRAIADQVKAEADIQNRKVEALAASAEAVITTFDEHARVVLLAAKEELKDSIESLVKAELEKQAPNADNTVE